MNLHPDLLAHPCVFAVEDTYRVMVGVNRRCLFSIEVGNRRFNDSAAGVMRSDCDTHAVTVPMSILDAAGEYTLCLRPVIDRKPYFPVFADEIRLTYAFKHLPDQGRIRIYHISDAHSRVQTPLAAGRHFGDALDLLVLNGDVLNHAGSPRDMQTVLLLGGALTEGGIPIVCSRGNHDMRGILAERVSDYLPACCGGFFYTFRLGRIWGVVLDCAEDKPDTNAEYGGTICCHAYREAQTAMLRDIVARKACEYAAEGVAYRLVIAHNPFSHVLTPPFDIEQDVYAAWCRILREDIRPDLMLTGHHHTTRVEMPGSAFDHLGQPCPVIVGSIPLQDGGFVGTALTLDGNHATIAFTDHEGSTRESHTLTLSERA